jgi:hypothetical protein
MRKEPDDASATVTRMSAAPPPNWYPDPYDATQLRWWDGTQWTEHRHQLDTDARATATASTPKSDEGTVGADTAGTSRVEEGIEERSAGAGAAGAPRVDPVANTADTAATAAATDQWAVPTSAGTAPRREREPQPISSSSTLPATQSRTLETRPSPARPSPPSNRRALLVALGVLAVILIGAIAFVLTRGDDDPDVEGAATTTVAVSTTGAATTGASTIPTTTAATTSRPATTAPATTAPLAGTTFTDPTNVYRIRVAPTWSDATTAGGLQTWATGTGSSTFRDSVNVLIEKLPIDISMDDYLAASVRNAPRSLPSFVEVGRSVTNVNGKVLGQLDFRSSQQIPLRHRAVVVIKGRNAIVVTYTAQPDRFDIEVANVQPYVTSVEGV